MKSHPTGITLTPAVRNTAFARRICQAEVTRITISHFSSAIIKATLSASSCVFSRSEKPLTLKHTCFHMPERLQDGPGRPKRGLRALQDGPRAAKNRPGRPKSHPRASQHHLGHPRAAWRAPGAAKRAPGGPQEAPGELPEAQKTSKNVILSTNSGFSAESDFSAA